MLEVFLRRTRHCSSAKVKYIIIPRQVNVVGKDRMSPKNFPILFSDYFFDLVVSAWTTCIPRRLQDLQLSTDRAEISTFFGWNILMRIDEPPNKRLYWNSNSFLRSPGFERKSSFQTFWILKKVLPCFNSGLWRSNWQIEKVSQYRYTVYSRQKHFDQPRTRQV